MRITRTLSVFTILALLFSATACRLSYVLHAAAGQVRLLHHSIPVEEALKKDTLSPDQRERLHLVAQVKAFGEKELGLKETENYQNVYLKSHQPPIYVVAASPKDRLTRKTWWFPVVGQMPSLGFFDKELATAEKEKLLKKDLDVIMGVADAYSTLGWFQDQLYLSLRSTNLKARAGRVMKKLLGTQGTAGGHGQMAGGQVDISAMTAADV